MSHEFVHSVLREGQSALLVQIVACTTVLALAIVGASTVRERLRARTRRDLFRIAFCLCVFPIVALTSFIDALRESHVLPSLVGDSISTLAITVQPLTEKRESEWPCFLAVVWLVGVAIQLTKRSAKHRHFVKVLERSGSFFTPADPSFARAFRSSQIESPITVGFLRSTLVVPEAFYELPESERHAILLHEAAHARNRDNSWELLLFIIGSLLWFHPLASIASHLHAQSREECCDETVLELLHDPAPYFEALARFASGPAVPAIASAFESAKLSPRIANATSYLERRRTLMKHRTVIGAAFIFGLSILGVSALPGTSTLNASALRGVSIQSEDVPFALDATLVQFHPNQFQLDLRASERATGKVVLAPRLVFAKGQDATIFSEDESTSTKFFLEVKHGTNGIIALHFVASRDGTEMQRTIHPLTSSYVPRAEAIHRVEAIYTPEARLKRVQGLVVVNAAISSSGEVTDLQVIKRLPFGLDKAAVDAIRQWKFRPAVDQSGTAIDSVQNIIVNFRLDEAGNQEFEPPQAKRL